MYGRSLFALLVLALLLLAAIDPARVEAAAPDDIAGNQRAWFDAADLNGNDDYTDNLANNSFIAVWTDKSGTANHISSSGTTRPIYRHDSISPNRHGVDFDGIDDHLTDTNDI